MLTWLTVIALSRKCAVRSDCPTLVLARCYDPYTQQQSGCTLVSRAQGTTCRRASRAYAEGHHITFAL
eukprot:14820-Heterococcus_DN1.PRE.10